MLKIKSSFGWYLYDHLLPYTINKKHDETLDSAVIQRIVTSKEPIPVLSMAQIVDGNITTDWIVRDCQVTKIGLGKYLQQIELDEPTELLKGIVLDTLTITQPLTTDTYHSRYKLDDVIDRLLAITPTSKLSETTKRINYKFKLDDNIRTLFHTIDSPEFFWNEYTLFDALVEIGTYLDKYPRVTFAEYNTTNKLTITFDDLDIVVKTSYTVTNSQTIETQQPLDNYANKVVSNVSNLSVDTQIVYPGKGLWVYLNAPFDQVDITVDNAVITLPFPIKRVIKMEAYLDNVAPENKYVDNIEVLEFNERQLWLGTGKATLPYYKYNDANIYNIKAYIESFPGGGSEPAPSVRGSMFRVTYIPLMDAKLVKKNNGTQDYAVIYNQTNNIVETSVFAKYLENYVKKMENGDEVISKIYKSFADVPLLGHIVNGKVLTNLSYEKYRDYYDVTMQLCLNHSRRSLFVRAKADIRTWEISADKVLNRSSVYNDKLTISIGDSLSDANTNIKDLSRIFPAGFSQSAVANLPSDGSIVAIDFKMRDTTKNVSVMLIPSISSFGNSLIFNFKSHDNTVIGFSKALNWTGEYVSKQTAITYTDSYGNIENIDIGFTDKYVDLMSSSFVAANYPLSTQNVELMNRAYIKVPDIIVQKDTRERLEFTYQLDIQGYNDTTIKSNLLKFALNRNYAYDTYVLLLYSNYTNDIEFIPGADICLKIPLAYFTKISANLFELTIDKTLITVPIVAVNSLAIAFDSIAGNNRPLIVKNNLTMTFKDNLVINGKINVYFK